MNYVSKVFSSSTDYNYPIYANEVIKGGTGYKNSEIVLPAEFENIYPDYDLYPNLPDKLKDTAFGFMTRGCPRNCGFCIVTQKEGCTSRKVADLNQFWNGQKNIKLLDPNIGACKDWKGLFEQLIESRARIDFTQGLDIRLMTHEKLEMLKKMRIKIVHFAWDNYDEKNLVTERLREIKESTGWASRKIGVYILTNYDTSHEEDLERVYTVRELGCDPFVMVYQKETLPPRHPAKSYIKTNLKH
jgi:hypothetical protein